LVSIYREVGEKLKQRNKQGKSANCSRHPVGCPEEGKKSL